MTTKPTTKATKATPELELEAEAMRALAKSRRHEDRLTSARSRACPPDVLSRFVRSHERDLVQAACHNPNLDLKDMEWALRWRWLDGAVGLATNPSAPQWIAGQLATRLADRLLMLTTAPNPASALSAIDEIRGKVRTPVPEWQLEWWWGPR